MSEEYIDHEGCTWLSYEDYVFNRFGYSNYSSITRDAVMQTLKELHEGDFFIRKSEGFEWAFQEFLLGVLSHFNLVEYGASPRGSWLTPEGKNLLEPLFTKEKK